MVTSLSRTDTKPIPPDLRAIRRLYSVAPFSSCRCIPETPPRRGERHVVIATDWFLHSNRRIPAYENATRTEGENIPKIPSLPISWTNAEVLIEELGGLDEGLKLNGRISNRTVKLVNHGKVPSTEKLACI